jgi:uncharacterized protein (TIGR00661 family)
MKLEGKKCMFFVQGEGRGHMTQSIAMKQILESAGVEVLEVVMGIGKYSTRQIPAFFAEKIKVPITIINSANMSVDKNQKRVKPMLTFLSNAANIPTFFKSVKQAKKRVEALKPDFIINFFEPACGLFYMAYRSKIPVINVAHHYMYHHPKFEMPREYAASRFGIRFYAWMNSFGSKKRLALSFYPFPDYPRKKIAVVPPLLREEVLNYPTKSGDYFLVYLLNHGYLEEIRAWHKKNLNIELHCFIDRKGMPEETVYENNLHVHQINDKKFLELMAGSKGLITTAGFESVCEAMYMGKPVLMVPVEDHYEQYCNAKDAERAGAGVHSRTFDIDKLIEYIAKSKNNKTEFREWVQSSPNLILRQIQRALSKGDNVRHLSPDWTPEKEIRTI